MSLIQTIRASYRLAGKRFGTCSLKLTVDFAVLAEEELLLLESKRSALASSRYGAEGFAVTVAAC
jgi:hypothetical protein